MEKEVKQDEDADRFYLTTLVPFLLTWMSTMVPLSEYAARLISENSA